MESAFCQLVNLSKTLHKSSQIFAELNMHCKLLGHSCEPRSRSCVLGAAGSIIIMTISLSINRCSHSKEQFEPTRGYDIDQFRSLGCSAFIGLTKFRQSLLFSSEIKKKTKGCSACWVSSTQPMQGFSGILVQDCME